MCMMGFGILVVVLGVRVVGGGVCLVLRVGVGGGVVGGVVMVGLLGWGVWCG